VKILHVTPTYVPAFRYGGPIVAIHGLCKALVARGHEVDVFTTNVDGPGTLDVPLNAAVDVDGVRVRYFASQQPRLYWSRDMRRALRQSVGAYDLVHTHAVYLWPGVAASRNARRSGVPYVISPRGMLVPELIARKSRMIKNLWLALVESRALAGASGIHFTAKREWHDALRTGVPLPSPFIVPNGLELTARPAVARDENTLLFVGRVSWKKGLDRAIAALQELPRARLLVAGNDEENLTPSLLELANRLGVRERVDFLGPVYGEAKNELMAKATLFVLLSQSENFANTVLEALAMETPVILSPEVGLADEVVRAGAGAIGAESIAPLLRDAQRRADMGRRGRALVESRFAWPRVAAEMEQQYARIVEAHRVRR